MNQVNKPMQKKRPAWLLPIVITLIVMAALALMYAAVFYFVIMGLQKTGTYLNGSPITVSDVSVERQVQQDLKWLPVGEFAAFDSKLGLTDQEKQYRDDITYFQQAGGCVITKGSIQKAQGGFDGGASITYDGSMMCAGVKVYDLKVRYAATVLGKKEASAMKSFRLQSAEITSEDGTRIDALSQRSGQSIVLMYRSDSNPTKGNWPTTKTFSSYAEYLTATTSGEFSSCEKLSQPRMRTILRWSEGVAEPSGVKQDIAAANIRCK